jgi:hypothetical protein
MSQKEEWQLRGAITGAITTIIRAIKTINAVALESRLTHSSFLLFDNFLHPWLLSLFKRDFFIWD